MTTPLDVFEAMWAARIPPAVMTYINAVNMRVDLNDAPDNWASAVVQPEARTDVTLGRNPWVEETGGILIGLFTRSGTGPKALDNAINYVRQSFHGARQDGLLIEQVDGPMDIDPEGVGEWWQVALVARYKFQTRRDASGPGFGDWSGFPETPPPPLPGP
jgi:hypothetical protein